MSSLHPICNFRVYIFFIVCMYKIIKKIPINNLNSSSSFGGCCCCPNCCCCCCCWKCCNCGTGRCNCFVAAAAVIWLAHVAAAAAAVGATVPAGAGLPVGLERSLRFATPGGPPLVLLHALPHVCPSLTTRLISRESAAPGMRTRGPGPIADSVGWSAGEVETVRSTAQSRTNLVQPRAATHAKY
jgi:hypothetical protein